MHHLPIDVLSLAIEREVSIVKDDFFFIQIGAHDGFSVDPIHRHIDKYWLKGILVEPQPRIFRRLYETYQNRPELLLLNAAISRNDGVADFHAFKDGQNLPYHASMLAGFNPNGLTGNSHGYRGEIETYQVTTLSVATLLKDFDVKSVDLLQIDTEGWDREIIAMFLESGVLPRIISFEDTQAGDEMWDRLAALGYGLSHHGIDTVAYLQRDNEEFRKRATLTQDDLNGLK